MVNQVWSFAFFSRQQLKFSVLFSMFSAVSERTNEIARPIQARINDSFNLSGNLVLYFQLLLLLFSRMVLCVLDLTPLVDCLGTCPYYWPLHTNTVNWLLEVPDTHRIQVFSFYWLLVLDFKTSTRLNKLWFNHFKLTYFGRCLKNVYF